ncbi:MAG TPA: hypothetical protein VJ860_05730 [Polyangia bacterium]|jgi:hypothetical protein|nr:hypothetical protein [Polyangia bacterium]
MSTSKVRPVTAFFDAGVLLEMAAHGGMEPTKEDEMRDVRKILWHFAGALCLLASAACSNGNESKDAANPDAAAAPDAEPQTGMMSEAGAAAEAGTCPGVPVRSGPFTRLTVSNAPIGMGINDPSVEYSERLGVWLMAYTAVVPSPLYQHISLAASNDKGATWSYLGDVTPVSPAISITTSNLAICGAMTCTGTWGQESAALLLDDFDPEPDRRIKVFAHAYYFDYVGDRQMDIGYLALYTAKDPAGPWTETKLFGWPSSSSISNKDVVYDIAADRALGLSDCVIVGEPAPLMRTQGMIDLALSCPKGTTDIRLLRSIDHGKTWTFVNTLLTAEDGPKLGSESNDITGADLFYANGSYHLIASPFGTIAGPGGANFSGYHGCVVVSIADMDAGQVARCDGVPVVEASYLGLPGQFMGACSAAEGLVASGMLIPIPDLSLIESGAELAPNTEIWQLFGSGTIP